MTAGLLLSLGAETVNPTGAHAFALLLIFRLSSKLHIYHGVPNMGDELLPQHLDYLKSYFGPKRLTQPLLHSIMMIVALAVYFGALALAAPTASQTVQAGLLCCLCLLAALGHFSSCYHFAIPVCGNERWANQRTRIWERGKTMDYKRFLDWSLTRFATRVVTVYLRR